MIKFSYHKNCIGKPEKRMVDGKVELWLGPTKINLGYGWITAELPFEDLYELLSVGGSAFAPALTCDHRTEDNFVSQQLALVDIDSGMTLEQLQQFPFYQLYGSGFYTTPSHTDTEPRFRIMYRLPEPITEPEEMRKIYIGLLAIHMSADPACKDAARLFYGTINAQHREITDRAVDQEGLRCIHGAYELIQQRQPPTVSRAVVADDREYQPKTVAEVEVLLDELRKYYGTLHYNLRRDVTWAVASAIGREATVAVMRARWSDAESVGKYEMFVNDRKRDAITLGTIYHLIRQHDPLYAKSARRMSMDELMSVIKQGNKNE